MCTIYGGAGVDTNDAAGAGASTDGGAGPKPSSPSSPSSLSSASAATSTSISISPRSSVQITSAEHQAQAGQDFKTIIDGVDESGHYDLLVVADGHGIKHTSTEHCTNVIATFRRLNWVDITRGNCPKIVAQRIRSELGPRTSGSGATLSIVKIYPDKIVSMWAGDSTINIFISGTKWQSADHNSGNPTEVERVKPFTTRQSVLSPCLKTTRQPMRGICPEGKTGGDHMEIHNPTQTDSFMIQIPEGVKEGDAFSIDIDVQEFHQFEAAYFTFKCNGSCMNMTNAFGHQLATHLDMQELRINPEDNIKIVLATDGLWDMWDSDGADDKYLQEMTADGLVNMAYARWMKQWAWNSEDRKKAAVRYDTVLYKIPREVNLGTPLNNGEPSREDDIAVITWSRKGEEAEEISSTEEDMPELEYAPSSEFNTRNNEHISDSNDDSELYT